MDETQAQLARWCHEAGCTPIQTECVLLWAQGWNVRRIREHLEPAVPNDKAAQSAVLQGAAKVAEAHPDILKAGGRFTRELIMTAANKDDHDTRPADVRGVEPDRASQRFQGARIVTSDRREVKQSQSDSVRHWIHQTRPVAVPSL